MASNSPSGDNNNWFAAWSWTEWGNLVGAPVEKEPQAPRHERRRLDRRSKPRVKQSGLWKDGVNEPGDFPLIDQPSSPELITRSVIAGLSLVVFAGVAFVLLGSPAGGADASASSFLRSMHSLMGRARCFSRSGTHAFAKERSWPTRSAW